MQQPLLFVTLSLTFLAVHQHEDDEIRDAAGLLKTAGDG